MKRFLIRYAQGGAVYYWSDEHGWVNYIEFATFFKNTDGKIELTYRCQTENCEWIEVTIPE